MFGERQPAQMYEDILAQVPLFHDLTKHELQVLSVNCRERDYPTGATLLRQGETGIGLFIITSGKVQITQQAPDGRYHTDAIHMHHTSHTHVHCRSAALHLLQPAWAGLAGWCPPSARHAHAPAEQRLHHALLL